MQGQDQRGILGNPQRRRRDIETLRPHPCDLRQQRIGIDHDAIADDAELASHQPARQQAQLVCLVADHQRMPGVMPALEPDDDIRPAGQPIHDLALAFVAPLGADHGDIGHSILRIERHGDAAPQ